MINIFFMIYEFSNLINCVLMRLRIRQINEERMLRIVHRIYSLPLNPQDMIERKDLAARSCSFEVIVAKLPDKYEPWEFELGNNRKNW